MKQRLAVVCLTAAVGTAVSVLSVVSTVAATKAAPAALQIVGKAFDLAAGDDPVEAFAVSGLSVTGASYEMKGADGSRFRVDRAASGRSGFVVISRVTNELPGGRAQWQVTAAVPVAVDTADAFTADCHAASGQISFLFYEPDKSGKSIRKAEEGFKLDIRTGAAERAKLAAADCRPGRIAAAPAN